MKKVRTPLLSRALRSRARSRGAAMVEAAVVLPVMVAFLGLTMMMHNAYLIKLQKNQQARSMVLDHASHQCKRQVIQYSGNSTGTGSTSTGGVSPGEGNASEIMGRAPGNAKTSGLMGKSQVSYQSSTVLNPKGVGNVRPLGGMGMTLRVNGLTSTALCNETPEDGSFGGMFGYIKGKILSFS